MTDRDRLIELLEDTAHEKGGMPSFKDIADYLLANGVKLPVRCKDCKDYAAVTVDGKPMHYGYCCNTHDDVVGSKHRYEGDFCSYGWLKECEGKC
jgi:hypothetical protein